MNEQALKMEIALLRTALLAQAPVGGLNDARQLIEQISRTAEYTTRGERLRRVTPEEWIKLTPDERVKAYVE